MKATRQSFVRGVVACAGGLAAAACGDEDDDDKASSNCEALIYKNHGHEVTVTKADVEAGATKTYNVKGSSAHSHTLVITAQQFGQTATNALTLRTSEDAGHSHQVQLIC